MKRFSPLPIALTLLTLIVGSGLPPAAWARLLEPGADRSARFEAHLQGRLQQLGLNESQQSTVQTLERTHAKEAIRLKAEIATMRVDLRQLLRTDPVDLSRVKPALQAMAAKEADLRLAHITLMQDIRQVLTPDQQKQFRSLVAYHHARDEGAHR
jgi:Spy/CpxP family protein refolding chaperone